MNLIPTPKLAPKDQNDWPKGLKKCKRGPKCAELKTNDMAVFPKPKLFAYIGKSKTSFRT